VLFRTLAPDLLPPLLQAVIPPRQNFLSPLSWKTTCTTSSGISVCDNAAQSYNNSNISRDSIQERPLGGFFMPATELFTWLFPPRSPGMRLARGPTTQQAHQDDENKVAQLTTSTKRSPSLRGVHTRSEEEGFFATRISPPRRNNKSTTAFWLSESMCASTCGVKTAKLKKV